MDGLAALGLASNILSFVDFTWKLLVSANEIYVSSTGIADDVDILDIVARDVKYHSGRIVAVSNTTPKLRSLVRRCEEIANELLKSLEKLRVKGDKTRWKSLLAAFKGVRDKRKVEELTDKISKVQVRISAHMQELLLNHVSGLGRDIRDLQVTHDRLGIEARNEVSSLKREVQKALEKLVDEDSAARMKTHFDEHQSRELDRHLIADISDQMRSLARAMDNLQVKGMEAGSSQRLLKKLHFASMSTRKSKIEDAHTHTFRWLVNPGARRNQPNPSLDFIEWLRSGDGVFWIYGKPGSGKSTFMKFVCAEECVRKHLKHWADDSQLVTPSFYFWYAGSRLQKSLEGLLRTLLFEILRHVPDVIQCILNAQRISVPFSDDEDWDLETLFAIYKIAIQQQKNVKFCFFIDGLDEFKDEEHRNLTDLTSALHRLETTDNIKLCVVSRPWTEFVDIYGHVPFKSLRLEDMTRDDIYAYVSDRFRCHDQFSNLMKSDPNYGCLIPEVVSRAQGVFLWVRLVVQILLEGLTFHDSVKTLLGQLTSFPEDLEEFFHQMLTSIPLGQRNRAAATLKVVAEADQPRLLIFFSFLDDLIQGEAPELGSSYTPLDPHIISSRCERMRRQLDGRSRGLLEVTTDNDMLPTSEGEAEGESKYFHLKVDFLHRTVRDFLVKSPRTKEFFDANISSNIALSIASATAAVSQLKHARLSVYDRPTYIKLLEELFFYTRQAASLETNTAAVDDLLGVAEELSHNIAQKNSFYKEDIVFAGLAAQNGHSSFLERKFLAGLSLNAIEVYDGKGYIMQDRDTVSRRHHNCWESFISCFMGPVAKTPVRSQLRRPLLDYALTPLTQSSAPYLDTIQLLLSRGASPNDGFETTTAWEEFLKHLDPQHSEEIRTAYFAITQLLLKNGASLGHEVSVGTRFKTTQARPSTRYPDRMMPFIQRNRMLGVALSSQEEVVATSARHIITEYFTPDQTKELIAVTRRRVLFGLL